MSRKNEKNTSKTFKKTFKRLRTAFKVLLILIILALLIALLQELIDAWKMNEILIKRVTDSTEQINRMQAEIHSLNAEVRAHEHVTESLRQSIMLEDFQFESVHQPTQAQLDNALTWTVPEDMKSQSAIAEEQARAEQELKESPIVDEVTLVGSIVAGASVIYRVFSSLVPSF